MIAASAPTARTGRPAEGAGLAAVFATMHLSWGAGFLRGCTSFGPPLAALARIVGLRALADLESRMRVGVYTDYSYSHDGESYYSERAFFTFITRLAGMVDWLVLFGRLNPQRGRSHYRVPDEIDFVPLPYYESQADARAAVRAMALLAARVLAQPRQGRRRVAARPASARDRVRGARGDPPQAGGARRAPGHAGLHAAAAIPASAG